MKTRDIILVVLTIVSSVGLLGARESADRSRGLKVTQQVVVISPNDFNLKGIQRHWQKYDRTTTAFAIVRLVFVTSQSNAILAARGKDIDHPSFSMWLDQTHSRSSDEIAEVLRLGEKTAVRIRAQNGNVRVYDPNHLLKMGPFNLAYLAIDGPSQSSRPHLFLTTTRELRQSDVSKLANDLKRKLGLEGLTISVRNDPWFVADTDYPWVNPFIPVKNLPTWQQFHSTAGVYCIVNNDNLACDTQATQRVQQ